MDGNSECKEFIEAIVPEAFKKVNCRVSIDEESIDDFV